MSSLPIVLVDKKAARHPNPKIRDLAGKEVYLFLGEDVLLNGDCYRAVILSDSPWETAVKVRISKKFLVM